MSASLQRGQFHSLSTENKESETDERVEQKLEWSCLVNVMQKEHVVKKVILPEKRSGFVLFLGGNL